MFPNSEGSIFQPIGRWGDPPNRGFQARTNEEFLLKLLNVLEMLDFDGSYKWFPLISFLVLAGKISSP